MILFIRIDVQQSWFEINVGGGDVLAIVADVDEHTADEVRETMRVCVK